MTSEEARILTRKSAFGIERWDEEDQEWEGGRLTRTVCTKKFTGELEGTSILEAVMLRITGDQGVMAYVGVERIDCTIDGRTGSFIVVHNAEAIGDDRNATWKILPGSGTGELVGISGQGTITPSHDFILDYVLTDVG